MKKILTIMLLTTAIPAVAMAQSLNVGTKTGTAIDTPLGGVQAGADTSLQGDTGAGANPAEEMEQDIKAGSEPVLNTNTTATTNTAVDATAPAPDMSATTDATANSTTATEIQAAEPAPADAPAEVKAEPSTAEATSTPATPAAEEPVKAAATATGVVKTRADLNRANVRQLQQALKTKGAYEGRVDGVWGDKTSAAITDFQSKNGLNVTGVLDESTINQLGVEFTASSKTSTNASTSQGNMDDAANRALESRVVPKSSMSGAEGAAAAGANAGMTTGTAPAPAAAPPAAAPATPPAGNPPESNTGYSTTY